MNSSVDTIVAEAVQLPPDQRLTLALRILRSVEPTPAENLNTAWDSEIRERITRYDAGTTKSVPASEVFAEIDRRLGR